MPLQATISRECWSGDFKARLVPRPQLGSHSGQRKAQNGHAQSRDRFMFPHVENGRGGRNLPVLQVERTPSFANQDRQATIGDLLPYFLAYLTYELHRSPQTIESYAHCMRLIVRMIGDMPPEKIRKEHVLLIKAGVTRRGAGPSRIACFMAALKAFLRFCQLAVGLTTIDPAEIHGPRIPKREVVFLTPEEVRQFVSAIPFRKSQRTFHRQWFSFRVLVEVLLGTGMRISEALSLKRSAINFAAGEAKIIGKGNKERVVFFSARALNWLKEYLTRRKDQNDAAFLDSRGNPLMQATALKWFSRIREKANLPKKVTAHILRHTMATTLLFNGCPIGHIKDILGHQYLVTTCNYYLGTDKRAAKRAHGKYLDYEAEESECGPEITAL
jgi:site-specific recombinase XerD